ncbi:cell wall anchor, partial [Enterococcus faecalis]
LSIKMAQKKRKQSFMFVMTVAYRSKIQRFMSAIHGNQKRTLFQRQIKQVKTFPSKKSLFQVKLITPKQAFIQSYTVTKVKKKQLM